MKITTAGNRSHHSLLTSTDDCYDMSKRNNAKASICFCYRSLMDSISSMVPYVSLYEANEKHQGFNEDIRQAAGANEVILERFDEFSKKRKTHFCFNC